jgi:MoaA/NifB/PqqE/SkfB family radical SAM enzyme
VAKEEFLPKWIAWEVTGRCNLNCIHCRASAGLTSHDTDFTTQEAKAPSTTSRKSPPPSWSFPAASRSCGKTSSRSRDTDGQGFRMCVATNGTLVTDEVVGKMKDAG